MTERPFCPGCDASLRVEPDPATLLVEVVVVHEPDCVLAEPTPPEPPATETLP